jgi:hypothetical protein
MNDNVDFEEKDIKILDYMLTRLKDGSLVQPDDLLKGDNIVPKGIKKKEVDKTFEHYVPVMQEYCCEHGKNGFGPGFLRRDTRTVNFFDSGGFRKVLENRYEQKKKEDDRERLQDEISRLTKTNLELASTNFELEKEKKLFDRKIRKWQVLSIILGIASAILTIVLAIKQGIL